MTTARQRELEKLETKIFYLNQAIDSLESKILELEEVTTDNSMSALKVGILKFFRPIFIQLRVRTGLSNEGVLSILEPFLAPYRAQPKELGMLLASLSLEELLGAPPGKVRHKEVGAEMERLISRFAAYISSSYQSQDTESTYIRGRKVALKSQLDTANQELQESLSKLANIKPPNLTDGAPEKLRALREGLELPNVHDSELEGHVLSLLPATIVDDLTRTQMTGKAILEKGQEILVLAKVHKNQQEIDRGICSGCHSPEGHCDCGPDEKLERTIHSLLRDTGLDWFKLTETYRLNHFPFFGMLGSSVEEYEREKLIASFPSSAREYQELGTLMISRHLLGDLLNFHWFAKDIEISRQKSHERMNLNRWLKSTTQRSLPAVCEALYSSIPGLTGDAELPVAWLLRVTEGATRFDESLEIFVIDQISSLRS